MSNEKKFIELVVELDKWIDENIAQCAMWYGGNEDEGTLGFLDDETESSHKLPQDINAKICEVSQIACNLFIDGKFRKDPYTIKRVREENPSVEFHILIGEQDSFGPVTYVLKTSRFQVVIC